MEELISNADELQEYFTSFHQLNEYHFNKNLTKKIYVKNKVRTDYLSSIYQGRYFIKGNFYDTKFDNSGGGLWLTYLVLASI